MVPQSSDTDVVENFDHAGIGLDRDDDRVRAIGEHAAGLGRLVGRGGVQQRLHPGRQMFLAHVGRVGDFGEADVAVRAVHGAGLDARVGNVGLQQMRADALDFLDQHAAGARHRAAGEHDRARARRCRSRMAPVAVSP